MSKKIVFSNGNISLSCSLDKASNEICIMTYDETEPIECMSIGLYAEDIAELIQTLSDLIKKMKEIKK